MTKIEHLLVCLMEECDEVSQRASRALRFGLSEVQPGQGRTNSERINEELIDLYAVCSKLVQEGVLEPLMDIIVHPEVARAIEAKRLKVEEFLEYSRECGTLQDDPR